MKTNRLTRLIFSVVLMFLLNVGNAQEKTDESKIKAIAEKACDCTRDISLELSKDSIVNRINLCISSANINQQIFESLTGQSLEKQIITDNDTISSKNVVNADENFSEIQAYMRYNCKYVKHLMIANNIKTDKSMSKNKKALEYYNEGQGYDNEEKFDMAVVSYNKAVKADPEFVFAWDNMGYSYRRLGNYKEAIKCYKRSLELDPKGHMPLMNIGTAYEKMKDYKNAGESFEKLIETYPQDPEGYFGAGRIFYIAGDYEKGVDYMFKAYKIYAEVQSPYFHDAEQNLAFYYNDLKEKGKQDIFYAAAKKNNIEIQE